MVTEQDTRYNVSVCSQKLGLSCYYSKNETIGMHQERIRYSALLTFVNYANWNATPRLCGIPTFAECTYVLRLAFSCHGEKVETNELTPLFHVILADIITI